MAVAVSYEYEVMVLWADTGVGAANAAVADRRRQLMAPVNFIFESEG